jgi:hypothetical protein
MQLGDMPVTENIHFYQNGPTRDEWRCSFVSGLMVGDNEQGQPFGLS